MGWALCFRGRGTGHLRCNLPLGRMFMGSGSRLDWVGRRRLGRRNFEMAYRALGKLVEQQERCIKSRVGIWGEQELARRPAGRFKPLTTGYNLSENFCYYLVHAVHWNASNFTNFPRVEGCDAPVHKRMYSSSTTTSSLSPSDICSIPSSLYLPPSPSTVQQFSH